MSTVFGIRSPIAWLLDEDPQKRGRFWSAPKDAMGCAVPPWIAGDEMTQSTFDLCCSMLPNTRVRRFEHIDVDMNAPVKS